VRLREVERALVPLDARRAELEALLSAGGDHRGLADAGRALAEVSARIAELEDRWLDLSSDLESAG
jgi:hypothetical protein